MHVRLMNALRKLAKIDKQAGVGESIQHIADGWRWKYLWPGSKIENPADTMPLPRYRQQPQPSSTQNAAEILSSLAAPVPYSEPIKSSAGKVQGWYEQAKPALGELRSYVDVPPEVVEQLKSAGSQVQDRVESAAGKVNNFVQNNPNTTKLIREGLNWLKSR